MTDITANRRMRSPSTALWGYGFRPFFLGAGLLAAVLIPWWAGALAWGLPLGTRWPPSLWHGHEMLFGFITAAIAGFLLTAVPSWTGRRGFAGAPLAALTALWLGARLGVSPPGARAPVRAGLNVAFFPPGALLI